MKATILLMYSLIHLSNNITTEMYIENIKVYRNVTIINLIFLLGFNRPSIKNIMNAYI